MAKKREHYSFSIDEGAKTITFNASEELTSRLQTVCNLLEMPRSSLVRFLVSDGLEKLEKRLVERAEKLRAQETG